MPFTALKRKVETGYALNKLLPQTFTDKDTHCLMVSLLHCLVEAMKQWNNYQQV